MAKQQFTQSGMFAAVTACPFSPKNNNTRLQRHDDRRKEIEGMMAIVAKADATDRAQVDKIFKGEGEGWLSSSSSSRWCGHGSSSGNGSSSGRGLAQQQQQWVCGVAVLALMAQGACHSWHCKLSVSPGAAAR